jgi:anti-sigma regulatory factor (Ser/Thr protein kinase)
MPFTQVRHVLTARPDAVPEARRLIRAYVDENCSSSAAIRDGVALAVSEAVGNVVRHAYRSEPGPVEITACTDGDRLEVTVRDWGVGLRQSPDPGLGLGLPLMRTMAEVSMHPAAEGGCRLVLRFPGPRSAPVAGVAGEPRA